MTSRIPLSQVEIYHKKKQRINSATLQYIQKRRAVVHGGYALNAHLSTFLDRPTQDFDIYAPRSKSTALQLERSLDQQFGGNFFVTKPGRHKGTYRVLSRVTEQEVADFTIPPKRLPTTQGSVQGRNVRIVTLPFIKKRIRKTLRDKKSEFRHAKDRDALRRILVQEELNRRKKFIARRRMGKVQADPFLNPFFTKPTRLFSRVRL